MVNLFSLMSSEPKGFCRLHCVRQNSERVIFSEAGKFHAVICGISKLLTFQLIIVGQEQ